MLAGSWVAGVRLGAVWRGRRYGCGASFGVSIGTRAAEAFSAASSRVAIGVIAGRKTLKAITGEGAVPIAWQAPYTAPQSGGRWQYLCRSWRSYLPRAFRQKAGRRCRSCPVPMGVVVLLPWFVVG